MNNFYKSKTMIFGMAVSILGTLQIVLPQFEAMFKPEVFGVLTTSIGAIIMILRSVTSVPMSEK